MASASCKYSCETRAETLEWIRAIVDFLKPYSFLMNAHVVNFFKDRLWEVVDKEWLECLRKENPEHLLLIPSGAVQDYWPASLKEFIHTLKSLSFPREQAYLQGVLPDLHMTHLNSVLSQGMNLKKKHEVEVLSAVVSSVVNSVGAHTVVDVGAGQGYLAQVLSFQYQHTVVAVDACSHHGNVTDARAARIKKHYAAQMRKSGNVLHALDSLTVFKLLPVSSGDKSLVLPVTITCRVLSTEMLEALADVSLQKDDPETNGSECDEGQMRQQSLVDAERLSSFVLAGLHACGDLSVTMLRTFQECTKVKAVVSIGCCYNLLSEEGFDDSCSHYGFPISTGLKSTGLSLGKNSRDLACQSAERWSRLGKDAGLRNFELHAFRAAFQMVLKKYYPEVMITSPSIGRQGKALRRQQQRKIHESQACQVKINGSSISDESKIEICSSTAALSASKKDEYLELVMDGDDSSIGNRLTRETTLDYDKSSTFEKFCLSGLSRLNLKPLQGIKFEGVWKEAVAFGEYIGPFWSLRAALGSVLETLILLDRLLFLQEQGGSIEAMMLPIFHPALSPRNVAIIAKRIDANVR